MVQDYSTPKVPGGNLSVLQSSFSHTHTHRDTHTFTHTFVSHKIVQFRVATISICLRTAPCIAQAPFRWRHARMAEIRHFLQERVADGSYVPVLEEGLWGFFHDGADVGAIWHISFVCVKSRLWDPFPWLVLLTICVQQMWCKHIKLQIHRCCLYDHSCKGYWSFFTENKLLIGMTVHKLIK